MALQYRLRVRRKAVSLLSDVSSGFNPTFVAIAAVYGVTPFAIDWSISSRNFAQCFVAPENIEASQILDFPGVTVYTTDDEDQGEPRGVPYKGDLILSVDFYVRLRQGAERNTEDLMDAVDDSVISVINNPAVTWTPGILFSRRSKGTRNPLQPLSDGFHQLVRREFQFGSSSPTL